MRAVPSSPTWALSRGAEAGSNADGSSQARSQARLGARYRRWQSLTSCTRPASKPAPSARVAPNSTLFTGCGVARCGGVSRSAAALIRKRVASDTCGDVGGRGSSLCSTGKRFHAGAELFVRASVRSLTFEHGRPTCTGSFSRAAGVQARRAVQAGIAANDAEIAVIVHQEIAPDLRGGVRTREHCRTKAASGRDASTTRSLLTTGDTFASLGPSHLWYC